jgi:hypothetical protein
MTSEGFRRKLNAILSADAVGYSRLDSSVGGYKTRCCIFSMVRIKGLWLGIIDFDNLQGIRTFVIFGFLAMYMQFMISLNASYMKTAIRWKLAFLDKSKIITRHG